MSFVRWYGLLVLARAIGVPDLVHVHSDDAPAFSSYTNVLVAPEGALPFAGTKINVSPICEEGSRLGGAGVAAGVPATATMAELEFPTMASIRGFVGSAAERVILVCAAVYCVCPIR